MKCEEGDSIKLSIYAIINSHLKRIDELEGHGLDRNGVLVIKREVDCLKKDIERYFNTILEM